MLVKRYWNNEWHGTLQPMIEIHPVDDLEAAYKCIFTYKMAGACSGYEIIDTTEEHYRELKDSFEKWQELQSLIVERWYDKAAMSRGQIGGPVSSARQFASRATRIK